MGFLSKHLNNWRMELNGQHRRASTQTHSNTSNGAGSGSGGTVTKYPSGTAFWPSVFAYSESTPTFEDAGIRAGEIIGYRAWYVGRLEYNHRREYSYDEGNILRSVAANYNWQPDDYHSPNGADPHSAGFHAFKTMEHVKAEYSMACYNTLAIVYGEIKLWGTVYEHQYGYRAEYARVHRLTEIKLFPGLEHRYSPKGYLSMLTKRYKCEPMPPDTGRAVVDSRTWTGLK